MKFSFDRRLGLTITSSSPTIVRLIQHLEIATLWLRRLRNPTPLIVVNLIIATAWQIALILA